MWVVEPAVVAGKVWIRQIGTGQWDAPELRMQMPLGAWS